MSKSEIVIVEQHGPVVSIVLRRAEKRNAINWPLMQALDTALDTAARSPGARVILIRGEGPCFSAGLDLSSFGMIAETFGEGWRDNMIPVIRTYQAVLAKLDHNVLPSIALLHGHCLGLGLELALACDMRIASEECQLGLPEAQLGLIPDVGGTTRLSFLVGPARAKELIMTGRSIDSELAERWGMVNAVVPQDKLAEKADELAGEIVRCAPLAVSAAKQIIGGLLDIERGLRLEALAQNTLIKTEDVQLGMAATLNKSSVKWKGR